MLSPASVSFDGTDVGVHQEPMVWKVCCYGRVPFGSPHGAAEVGMYHFGVVKDARFFGGVFSNKDPKKGTFERPRAPPIATKVGSL